MRRLRLPRLGRALAAGLVAGAAAVAAAQWGLDSFDLRPRRSASGHVEVIDGDSLRLGGLDLRLEGVDAPELRQTCLDPAGPVPCGRHARDLLAELARGGGVTCRIGREDRYGRGLALCSARGVDLNRELVLRGAAMAHGRFEAEEAQARTQRRGIWATRFEPPAEWRARNGIGYR